MSKDAGGLQRILNPPRPAWEPYEGESEADFVARNGPPRPAWYEPWNRRHYDRTLGEALRRGVRRDDCDAVVLPFWVAENEDEEPRDDEWKRSLLVWGAGELVTRVAAPKGTSFWARASVTRVRRSYVALARKYTLEARRDRSGPFHIVEAFARLEVVRFEMVDIAMTPAPRRIVPAFSRFLEAAFDVGAVPEAIRTLADEIVTTLQFEPDEPPDEDLAPSYRTTTRRS